METECKTNDELWRENETLRARLEEAVKRSKQVVAEHQATEEALRESETKLREALKIGQMGYLDWDLTTNVITWSEETYRIYGYNPAEFTPTIASTILMIHPEDREYVQQRLEAAIRGERDYAIEHRMLRPDGGTIHVQAHAEVMHDAQGKPRRMLGTVIDITARKSMEAALRRSEERFRSLVETTSDWIWEVDAKGVYTYSSPKVQELLGYAAEEIVGKTCFDPMPPEEIERLAPIIRRTMENKEPFRNLENVNRHRDGRLVILETNGVPVLDAEGNLLGYRGVDRDISARKGAEEALRESEAQLARHAWQLVEADRRKDEFLAMLAHELRNPLAPIRNAVQLLRQSGMDPSVWQRQHDIIDRQVAHMARLLDDLLDVSRITHGKIELKPQAMALSGVLAQAIEIAEPLILARRQMLCYTPPAGSLGVLADPDRVAQALGNLLVNASKYTEPGGRIWLETECEEDGAGVEWAVIRVRDNGMGIDSQILPAIFELFIQAERSLDRTQGGLGIGLTLARRLIQMHGGTIEAHSAGFGQGSEFTIRLPAILCLATLPETCPAGEDAAQRALAAHPAPAPHPARRILVVDDVADTAESMAELLESWEHQARVVYDGLSAQAAAREFLPDTVLLDIGLPGMDGYEVARRLRQEFGPELLLVALTGYGQESDRECALRAGFDHHLPKPVDLAALRGLLGA